MVRPTSPRLNERPFTVHRQRRFTRQLRVQYPRSGLDDFCNGCTSYSRLNFLLVTWITVFGHRLLLCSCFAGWTPRELLLLAIELVC